MGKIKILSIKKIKETKEVWDLTIEDDHSFVAEGVIAHNCMICASKDGRQYIFGKSKVEQPPLHPLCRCFIDHQIPIFTSKGFRAIGKIKVGDLVLTHKGRFRKVSEVIRNREVWPDVVTITVGLPNFWINQSKNRKGGQNLTVTREHPFFIEGEWVKADEINVGQKIKFLASNCKRCGKLIPYNRIYCSQSCNSKGITDRQWSDPEHRKNVSKKNSIANLQQYQSGEKDLKRQKKIESLGWMVLRFTDTEINSNIKSCGDEVQRVLMNHRKEYKFIELEVIGVRNWRSEKVGGKDRHPIATMLYNIAVEEDESYIANGFVAHNCILVPITKSWKELGATTDHPEYPGSRPFVYKGTPPPGLASKMLQYRGDPAKWAGRVPDTMRYNDWLKMMDVEDPNFVREILGSQKYGPWKDGILTFADMVKDNRLLTLEELDELGKLFTKMPTTGGVGAENLEYRQFDDWYKADKWVGENFSRWASKLSTSDLEAIKNYESVDMFDAINNYLRTGKVGVYSANEINNVVKILDKIQTELPENIYLFRAATNQQILPKIKALKNLDNAAGIVFTDKAYASTSMTDWIAREYFAFTKKGEEKVFYKIRVPKGSKVNPLQAVAKKMPEYDIEENPGVLEMLLPRNSSFRIVKVNKVDDVWEMEVDFLGKAEPITKGVKAEVFTHPQWAPADLINSITMGDFVKSVQAKNWDDVGKYLDDVLSKQPLAVAQHNLNDLNVMRYMYQEGMSVDDMKLVIDDYIRIARQKLYKEGPPTKPIPAELLAKMSPKQVAAHKNAWVKTKQDHDIAELMERKMARRIGAEHSTGSKPFDMFLDNEFIEFKTILNNTEGAKHQIWMDKAAKARKAAFEKKYGVRGHTVVIEQTPGSPNFGKIYYKKGFANYRLNTMIEVRDDAHLVQLLKKGARKFDQPPVAKSAPVKTTSLKQSENFAKKTFGLKEVDYDDIDNRAAKLINQYLGGIAKEYKVTPTSVRINDVFFTGNNRSLAGVSFEDGTVAFNPKYFKSLDDMTIMAKDQFQVGRFSTSSRGHVVRHELAHQKYFQLGGTEATSARPLSEAVVKDLYKEIGPTDMPRFVSEYAFKNEGEFYAEAMAKMMNGDALHPVVKRIINQMERRIGKGLPGRRGIAIEPVVKGLKAELSKAVKAREKLKEDIIKLSKQIDAKLQVVTKFGSSSLDIPQDDVVKLWRTAKDLVATGQAPPELAKTLDKFVGMRVRFDKIKKTPIIKKVEKPPSIVKIKEITAKPTTAVWKNPVDFDELSKVAEERLRIDTVSIQGFTKKEEGLNLAKLAMESLDNLHEQFPELKTIHHNYLLDFVVVDAKSFPGIMGDDIVGSYLFEDSMLQIAARGKSLKHTLQLSDKKYLTSNDYFGLIRHEYGHRTSQQLSEEVRKAWEVVFNKNTNLFKKVSKYAQTNDEEAFAEVFSAYTSPLYRRGVLPKALEGYFDDLLKTKARPVTKGVSAEVKVVKKPIEKAITVKDQELVDKIKELPGLSARGKLMPQGRGDYVDIKPFFKEIMDEKQAGKLGDWLEDNWKLKGKIKNIDIDKIIPSQNLIRKEGVINKLQGLGEEFSDHPLIVKENNKNYIMDGHHRIFIEKMKGSKQIKVEFINYDQIKKGG